MAKEIKNTVVEEVKEIKEVKIEEATKIENTTKEEIKMENKKTLFEVTNEEIVKVTKGTKIVPQEAKTGISYFQGKNRLCKVLNTKKGISMEVNITLSKEIEKEFGLERISAATAYKKHLGTMKYMVRLNDEKSLPKLLKLMVAEFIKVNTKVEEDKEAKAQ